MDWTEINIEISADQVDEAAAIAQMVVPYGIYIEDYSDLRTEAPKSAHIDLIDEELHQNPRYALRTSSSAPSSWAVRCGTEWWVSGR